MSSSTTPRCVVPGCDGLFMTTQPGPYYLLQGRDQDLLTDWLRACKYSDQDIERQISNTSNNDVICASHFIGRKFRSDVANQRIPSLFHWSQCCTSEENSRQEEVDMVVVCDKGDAQQTEEPSTSKSCTPAIKNLPCLSPSARRLSELIAKRRMFLTSESESLPKVSKRPKVAESSIDLAETFSSAVSKPSVYGRCVVPGCDGYFRGENTSSVFKPKYFTLPLKDEKMLQEWLMAIGITSKHDLSAGKICCTHFKDGLFSASDPLHRMPIVFAPKHDNPATADTAVTDPKVSKTGLKPHMKPHFARKPVPMSDTDESESQSSGRFVPQEQPEPNKQHNLISSGNTSVKDDNKKSAQDFLSIDSKSSGTPSIDELSDSDSCSSSNSSSSESVIAMPKLHSAAVTSGLRNQNLTVLSPEGLCTMILDNYSKVGSRDMMHYTSTDEDTTWLGLAECDVAPDKSYGFDKFLFSLGLNIVRRRVYQTALSAATRQEKAKKGTPVLSSTSKAALEKAVQHFDADLGIGRLDSFVKPSNIGKQKCSRCLFTTESRLVLDWHRRQPHFDRTKHGHVFCCLCNTSESSMRMSTYREHLRYSHGCSFVTFDLFTQPYQCHYCTASCSTWQVLLSHMNNCRLTFNIYENLRPDPKTDVTLAVNLSKPPDHVVIDRLTHTDNPIYKSLIDKAISLGLRPENQQQPLQSENSSFVDISLFHGLQPFNNSRTLASLGFDDTNQEFASFFGYLRPVPPVATRTTVFHVPQSTAIVQIVQTPSAPLSVPPPPIPPVALQRPSLSIVTPKPLQTSQRLSFAPPSELPSSFRPIRVAKLPEITMATIAAATVASRPPLAAPPVKPGLLEPLPAPPIREAPMNSVIKRPQPPFTGAIAAPQMIKRFRQTEFTLTTMQRLLFCELCRGIVQEREAMRIHLFWAHRIGLPPSAMITDEWYAASCPSCGLGFYTPDGIERHNVIGCYNDIFVPTFCVVCHKFLSTSSLLCAHLAKEHGLTPPSMTRARVCFICSSAFDSEEHCADHLQLGHQLTTEPNSERDDYINVIWQGQIVASVDPEAIGAEAAAAMLSLQAAAAFGGEDEGSMLIERIDSSAAATGGLGSFGNMNSEQQSSGITSANRMVYFAARGGVAAPFRRGPGRPPLSGRGRPRGSRARGPYRPRGSRGPYRPRGSRGSRGPGRPPISSTKRAGPKRRAPRDPSAAGKAQWFHEEFSLSETDESEIETTEVPLDPDDPEVDLDYDEDYDGYYDREFEPKARQSARRSMHKYY